MSLSIGLNYHNFYSLRSVTSRVLPILQRSLSAHPTPVLAHFILEATLWKPSTKSLYYLSNGNSHSCLTISYWTLNYIQKSFSQLFWFQLFLTSVFLNRVKVKIIKQVYAQLSSSISTSSLQFFFRLFSLLNIDMHLQMTVITLLASLQTFIFGIEDPIKVCDCKFRMCWNFKR